MHLFGSDQLSSALQCSDRKCSQWISQEGLLVFNSPQNIWSGNCSTFSTSLGGLCFFVCCLNYIWLFFASNSSPDFLQFYISILLRLHLDRLISKLRSHTSRLSTWLGTPLQTIQYNSSGLNSHGRSFFSLCQQKWWKSEHTSFSHNFAQQRVVVNGGLFREQTGFFWSWTGIRVGPGALIIIKMICQMWYDPRLLCRRQQPQ